MALLGNLTGSSQFFSDELFYNGVATQSLRFDGSNSKLTRTPSSSGNQKKWTTSFWVKRSKLGTTQYLWSGGSYSGNDGIAAIYFGTDNKLTTYFDTSGANPYGAVNDRVYRDPSAWYHIVWAVDAANTVQKIWVNGVEESLSSSLNPPNYDYGMNRSGTTQAFGIAAWGGSPNLDGYLAEITHLDGQYLDETYFGEFKNGVWIAKDTSGLTFGTNGFRFKFDQVGVGTASTTTIGADTSGQTNHFTSSGIVASDCAMPDSPENNFCTANSIREDALVNGSVTLSEGNLQSVDAGTTYSLHWTSTFEMSSGKWYWEVLAHTLGGDYANIGVCNAIHRGTTVGTGVFYGNDGKRNAATNTGGNTSYGASYTNGDIVGIAFDADNETVTFYKNNSSQGAVGSVLTQANGGYFAGVGDGQNSTTYKYVANFGQDSSFAGNKTAQGNTDGNGIGDFYYTPPSGFLALCTANLPEPTIGPNSATQADDYFNTVLYTGSGSSPNAITGVGFQPDWVWIKKRSATISHAIFDSSRGVTSAGATNKAIGSNRTDAEGNGNGGLSAFGSDGFTLVDGSSGSYPRSLVNDSATYVAWSWKANGGTTSSNTDGSITSTVQANTDAGFSIVTYTIASGVQTVGHGLTKAPELIINKGRASATAWWTHTTVIDGTLDYVRLDDTNAKADDTQSLSLPTTTTFGMNEAYTLQQNVVSYCFHSVEGYSKIGTYTGNGNADGTFVYTGFRPAWVMVKRTDSTNNWMLSDSARDTDNVINNLLYANLTNAEYALAHIDFTSNGFKLRTSNASWNASSGTYIYMAFAEAPFKYANAR